MRAELAALVADHARAAARRAAVPVAFALMSAAFAAVAVVGFFGALFFSLAPTLGPLNASLIVAACALALAVLASTPLWIRSRPKSPPPSQPALGDFVGLLTKSAPSLSPRQIALAAVLLALALGLMAGRKPDDEK